MSHLNISNRVNVRKGITVCHYSFYILQRHNDGESAYQNESPHSKISNHKSAPTPSGRDFASLNSQKSSSFSSQVVIEPPQNLIGYVGYEFGFGRAVACSGVEDHFGIDALFLKGPVEFLSLTQRYPQVV